METNNIPKVKRELVSLESLKPGDTIYLSTKDDAPAYLVLDIGSPFILIENLRNHFANLYRPTLIYKEVLCQ